MRFLVRTEAGLFFTFVTGLLVSYVGLALAMSGPHRLVGGGILLIGLWVVLSAPQAHNDVHRDRGEEGHRLWAGWWP